MEPNITMHHGYYNVSYSYYCHFYRCPVTVTFNEQQWKVHVAAETFSCSMFYLTHSSAGPLASEWSNCGQRLSTARYLQSNHWSGSVYVHRAVSTMSPQKFRTRLRVSIQWSLLLRLHCILTGSVGSKQKACAMDSFLSDPEDGLFPREWILSIA